MKRLCIFVTYDHEGIVDGYIGYMLQRLRNVVDFLCVVCNYKFVSYGLGNVQLFADRIFYRENMGYDAGAYKDVLCRELGWDVICGYDELLLVNDSFFGPFYAFEELFDRMHGTGADYWGMTRSPQVRIADGHTDVHTYESHIQSYFFSLRKRILQNRAFQDFWETMIYPASFTQAVIHYEIGLNRLLRQLGFKGITVMDLSPVQWELKKGENPHLLYPLELIRDAGIPLLKRKSLSLSNRGFGSAIGALRFIQNECGYDVSLIENHLRRFGKGMNIMGIDRFYAIHTRIFIYGAGLYGRNAAEYFAYKGWTFEKFLVTDAAGQSGNDSSGCVAFDEADIAEDDGIIVAVGSKKVFAEIVQLIQKRCRKEQIFNPEDTIW